MVEVGRALTEAQSREEPGQNCPRRGRSRANSIRNRLNPGRTWPTSGPLRLTSRESPADPKARLGRNGRSRPESVDIGAKSMRQFRDQAWPRFGQSRYHRSTPSVGPPSWPSSNRMPQRASTWNDDQPSHRMLSLGCRQSRGAESDCTLGCFESSARTQRADTHAQAPSLPHRRKCHSPKALGNGN